MSSETPEQYGQAVDEIQEAVDEAAISDNLLDVAASRTEIVASCRTSLDFLASLVLTEIYEYGYPAIFHAMWNMICNASLQLTGKHKYALGIPRGFSKTIVMKLWCLWLILFSDRRFILIVCNTASLAENFMADVADMLDHPNIKAIFGDWRTGLDKDTQAYKKFSFRGRHINIAAIGAGGSLRGLNLKFVRPDIVLMDDMQNRDEAGNPEVAKEMLIWMMGTLMKACHPRRCVYVFVGNMYPFEGSILRKLKHSPDWVSFITAGILADGQSLWPEHRSIEDLLAEFEADKNMGLPEIFYSEVMNDEEAGTVSGIDVSKIPLAPENLDKYQAQGGAIIIDPSLAKKKSDDTGIGAMLLYDGIPVFRELVSKKLDPYQTIQQATFMALRHSIQLIVVEGVAYQSSLIFWFERVYSELGIQGLMIGEISPEGMAKNARIKSALRLLLEGQIILHPKVRSQVIYQITQWNPVKMNNKDELLDIMAYFYKVIEMFPDALPLMLSVNMSDSAAEASHTDTLELAF